MFLKAIISSRMWISYEIISDKKSQQKNQKKTIFLLGKVKDVFFLFPYYIFGLYFPKVTKKPEKNNVLLLYDHWKVTPEPIVLQKQIKYFPRKKGLGFW